MRFTLRNLVLSSAAFCATTAFAANQARLDVPFSFVVKNHEYHAGAYRVEVDPQRSLITLSNLKESTQPLQWIVEPGNGDPNHPKVCLTFDVMGPDHVLRMIQYGTLVTPNLDPKPKRNVESTRTIGD